jgi:clan AA aspartic protease (TIGR02281 family)
MKRTTILHPFLAAALTFAAAIVTRADDPASPDPIFANRGLTTSDVWLVLPAETDVHNAVWKIKQKAQTVLTETTSRRDLRFQIQKDRHDLESLIDNLVAADRQIDRLIATRQHMSQDDRDYNLVIGMYNDALTRRDSIADRINSTRHDMDDSQTKLDQVLNSRGDYSNSVMDAAAQAESLAADYARLSQDNELTTALAAANANAHPPLKLGPSGVFTADLEYLRKAVKDVVDSPIPVRRGENSELYVQAVLNGKVPDEMIWDSGADVILLSAETARGLGLKLTDQNPEVDMGSADGKIHKAREALLDSVRLGGFTVKNVICFVLPDTGNGHETDLLGDTFQTHFVSRMDQRSQQLQLTPIDSSVQVGPTPQAPQP